MREQSCISRDRDHIHSELPKPSLQSQAAVLTPGCNSLGLRDAVKAGSVDCSQHGQSDIARFGNPWVNDLDRGQNKLPSIGTLAVAQEPNRALEEGSSCGTIGL